MEQLGFFGELLRNLGIGAGTAGTLLALFLVYKIIKVVRGKRNNPGKDGPVVEVLREIKEETRCVKKEIIASREKHTEDFSELSTDLKILLDRKER